MPKPRIRLIGKLVWIRHIKTTRLPPQPLLDSHNHSLADRPSAKLSSRIPNQVTEIPTQLKYPQLNCGNSDRVTKSLTQLKNPRSPLPERDLVRPLHLCC